MGGPRGIKILIGTILVGATLFLLAYAARQRMSAPKGVIATELAREQVLSLGAKARGPMAEIGYVAGAMARVSSFAAAKQPDGRWDGLVAGSVLQVKLMTIDDGDSWVTGIVQGGPAEIEVTVHATFLEQYLPVVLEKTLEVSDLRLMLVKSGSQQGLAISGWVRNITSEPLQQCIVTCVFQDKNEREVDIERSEPMTLPPLAMVRFQTGRTEQPFGQISIQITHATPDRLRNYLPTIVVKRASLQ